MHDDEIDEITKYYNTYDKEKVKWYGVVVDGEEWDNEKIREAAEIVEQEIEELKERKAKRIKAKDNKRAKRIKKRKVVKKTTAKPTLSPEPEPTITPADIDAAREDLELMM